LKTAQAAALKIATATSASTFSIVHAVSFRGRRLPGERRGHPRVRRPEQEETTATTLRNVNIPTTSICPRA